MIEAGKAGGLWLVQVWIGGVWQGMAGKVWQAGQGAAWFGEVWLGMAGNAKLQKGVILMVFEWKTKGIFKDIDANIAGAELERIKSENGELTAAGIVNASRSKRSPLHSCFEWRDDIAAERYREQQARVLVANIIVKQVEGKTEYPVRAFIHINGDYKPIETVIADVELTNSMLEMAKREMVAFRDKYKTLTELAGVFSAIESVCDDGQ